MNLMSSHFISSDLYMFGYFVVIGILRIIHRKASVPEYIFHNVTSIQSQSGTLNKKFFRIFLL